MPDLDQGGTFRETSRVYLGPSLGWSQQVSAPPVSAVTVTTPGTTVIQQGVSTVHVNVNGSVTIQLYAAKGNAAGAGQVPGSWVQTTLTVNDIGGHAQAFPITILPAAGETIGGAASVTIGANFGLFVMLSDVQNGGWTVASGTSGTALTDAPSDGSNYGRLNAAWAKVLPLAGGTLTGALTVPGLTVNGNGTVTGTFGVSGILTAPTAAANTNTTQVATTAYVIGQAYATLASPTFTGTPVAPTPTTADNSTKLATTAYVKSQFLGGVGAVLQTSPANPTGTTSVTAVMMGLGGTCTLTPVFSTRVRVQFIGDLVNTSPGSATGAGVRYGTGAAPANAAAATGTTAGSSVVGNAPVANGSIAFAAGGIITGLTPGTAYWFDLAVNAAAGTGSVTNLSFSAQEI